MQHTIWPNFRRDKVDYQSFAVTTVEVKFLNSLPQRNFVTMSVSNSANAIKSFKI